VDIKIEGKGCYKLTVQEKTPHVHPRLALFYTSLYHGMAGTVQRQEAFAKILRVEFP